MPARRPPTRTCVACRTERPKRELLRVVRAPDGRVLADPGGRANGRGAYVCATAACINDGIERGTLARALETPVPASIGEELMAATGAEHDGRGGSRGEE